MYTYIDVVSGVNVKGFGFDRSASLRFGSTSLLRFFVLFILTDKWHHRG